MAGNRLRWTTKRGVMSESKAMNCPKCGANMNQHAEKLVDPCHHAETLGLDPTLPGVLHQIFACPGCGATASRIAG
jgi:predicted RNA-binding Zn-ribbon protein involved in translation (DUF1610 family)